MNLITTYPRHFCESQWNPLSFIQTDLSTSMACLCACHPVLSPQPFKYVLGMLIHLSEAAKGPWACMLVPGLCASSTSMSDDCSHQWCAIVLVYNRSIMLVVVGLCPRRCTSRNSPFIPWSCHLIPSKLVQWRRFKSMSC